MGIFDKIKGAIWGQAKAAEAAPTTTAATANPEPASTPAPSATTAATSPATSAPSAPVDIASILDAAVKKSGQKLDWKHSIVDLMKALGMDASLSERKELAQELGYTGDAGDSAKMNMFLHKALLKKLSDNGGKVPADLLD
jgi:3-oxoacyl-ACP reductase-like protein